MQSETIVAVIITFIVSPIAIRVIEFVFRLIDGSKTRTSTAIGEMGNHITLLEKQIIEMKDLHLKDLEGLRHSLERDYDAKYEVLRREIDELRAANTNLRIEVGKNEVRLSFKDEIITQLREEMKRNLANKKVL